MWKIFCPVKTIIFCWTGVHWGVQCIGNLTVALLSSPTLYYRVSSCPLLLLFLWSFCSFIIYSSIVSMSAKIYEIKLHYYYLVLHSTTGWWSWRLIPKEIQDVLCLLSNYPFVRLSYHRLVLDTKLPQSYLVLSFLPINRPLIVLVYSWRGEDLPKIWYFCPFLPYQKMILTVKISFFPRFPTSSSFYSRIFLTNYHILSPTSSSCLTYPYPTSQ